MTILVPIDEHPASEAGLREAHRLARQTGDSLIMVSVGELPETSRHRDDERDELGRRLRALSAGITDVPLRCRVELAGDPVRGILDVAREEGAGRIVIASPERGIFAALAHDSVSGEVGDEAPIPVTVVETDEQGAPIRSKART